MKEVKSIKKGDLFRLIPNGPIWVRGEYERSLKKFSCYKYDDVNKETFLKGDRMVYLL